MGASDGQDFLLGKTPMAFSEEWSSCNDALGTAERVLGILAEGRVVEDADTFQRGAGVICQCSEYQ